MFLGKILNTIVKSKFDKKDKLIVSFDYYADHTFFVGNLDSEGKPNGTWGYKNIPFKEGPQKDGGMDIQLVAKMDDHWEVLWHEFLDPTFKKGSKEGRCDLDITKYSSEDKDVTIGIWVIGADGKSCGIDNILMYGKDN